MSQLFVYFQCLVFMIHTASPCFEYMHLQMQAQLHITFCYYDVHIILYPKIRIFLYLHIRVMLDSYHVPILVLVCYLCIYAGERLRYHSRCNVPHFIELNCVQNLQIHTKIYCTTILRYFVCSASFPYSWSARAQQSNSSNQHIV